MSPTTLHVDRSSAHRFRFGMSVILGLSRPSFRLLRWGLMAWLRSWKLYLSRPDLRAKKYRVVGVEFSGEFSATVYLVDFNEDMRV